jgi:hypothetical protein
MSGDVREKPSPPQVSPIKGWALERYLAEARAARIAYEKKREKR